MKRVLILILILITSQIINAQQIDYFDTRDDILQSFIKESKRGEVGLLKVADTNALKDSEISYSYINKENGSIYLTIHFYIKQGLCRKYEMYTMYNKVNFIIDDFKYIKKNGNTYIFETYTCTLTSMNENNKKIAILTYEIIGNKLTNNQ